MQGDAACKPRQIGLGVAHQCANSVRHRAPSIWPKFVAKNALCQAIQSQNALHFIYTARVRRGLYPTASLAETLITAARCGGHDGLRGHTPGDAREHNTVHFTYYNNAEQVSKTRTDLHASHTRVTRSGAERDEYTN